MAYELANKILDFDEENLNKLANFCYKYLDILEN